MNHRIKATIPEGAALEMLVTGETRIPVEDVRFSMEPIDCSNFPDPDSPIPVAKPTGSRHQTRKDSNHWVRKHKQRIRAEDREDRKGGFKNGRWYKSTTRKQRREFELAKARARRGKVWPWLPFRTVV
jgi:hypothetical protein